MSCELRKQVVTSNKNTIIFLKLRHTRFDVFSSSGQFVLECYKITRQFPADKKFRMISQIRRAALSVHLNIAESCSRKSGIERCRYFEISRGSVIEVDTAFAIAVEFEYVDINELEKLGQLKMSRSLKSDNLKLV